MDLSDKEIAILRRIVTEDAIDILYGIANKLNVQWSVGSVVDEESAHRTLVNAIRKEERAKALSLFLDSVKKLAHGS